MDKNQEITYFSDSRSRSEEKEEPAEVSSLGFSRLVPERTLPNVPWSKGIPADCRTFLRTTEVRN